MATINLELTTTQGMWKIFKLVSFGAEVERKVGPGEYPPKKKVWATLESPADQDVLVAIATQPGAGSQPDNTCSMAQLHDIVAEVVRSLEWTLDDVYGKVNTTTQTESW